MSQTRNSRLALQLQLSTDLVLNSASTQATSASDPAQASSYMHHSVSRPPPEGGGRRIRCVLLRPLRTQRSMWTSQTNIVCPSVRPSQNKINHSTQFLFLLFTSSLSTQSDFCFRLLILSTLRRYAHVLWGASV